MKLRLPQALLAAILVAASSVEAVTFTSNKVTLTDLTANQVINYNGVTYTVTGVTDGGMVTMTGFYPATGTISDPNPAITMGLKTDGISTKTADIMYVTGGTTVWGLSLKNGAFRGIWGTQKDYNTNNSATGTLSESGVVTATVNNTGTKLFNGTATTTTASDILYSTNKLVASTQHIDNVTFNKGVVDYVYLNDATTTPSGGVEKYYVTNADGTWTRLYSTWYKAAAGTLTAPTNAVEATFVTEGKTAVTGGNAITNINAKCGDIIVGGSGQLSQGTGVTLSRDVYIGATDYAETGDHAAASGCAIRLDAGTFANVSLIEDASIYVMYSSGSAGGYITTLNLGSHTMTKQGAGNLFINGLTEPETGGAFRVAAGTLTLNARSISTVNSTITVADGATFAVYNQDSGNNDTAQLTVNNMVLEGNATLRIGDDNKHRARLHLGNINSTAGQDIVLTVSDAHPSSGNAAGVVFKNGITGTMSGRLDVCEPAVKNDRQFAVFLEDEDFLKDTVVNIAEHNSGGEGYIMLMVGSNNTSEIQVKGLDSNSAITKNYKAISYNGNVTAAVSSSTGSSGGHTLVITGDGNYTFNGDFGDTLGVKMTGTGSQTLKNVGANAVADAGAGHLTISNAVGNNTVLRVGGGQLTVNGTLGTNVTLVSDGGWTLNNSSHKYEYSYDIADHVDGTNASTLLDSVSYAFVASGNGENSACSTLDATNFHHATLILQSDTTPGTTAAGAYVNAGSTWGSDVQKLVMDGANLISLSGQTNTVSQNIELKGNTAFRTYGDPILHTGWGGDSRAHATMILTGELSGAGNIIHRDGGTLVLKNSSTTGWTGGLVLEGNGGVEVETSMNAASLSLSSQSVLRIGKENTGVTLTLPTQTGYSRFIAAGAQNIELGNGGALVINGRLTFNQSVLNIGTINSIAPRGDTREGDYGSVTVTALSMGRGDGLSATLNIGANTAFNVTGEGKTMGDGTGVEAGFATATLYLMNWKADSIINVNGTFNALDCQYISVVDPTTNNKKAEMNVKDGGVVNMKGLVLQCRQDQQSKAWYNVNLEAGSMLNIGSEGIQKGIVNGSGSADASCRLNISMGEGVTLGNLNGSAGWSSDYDFTGAASFNNTTINTQNYVAKTDGSAGAVDATDTTGGTITLTGNVNGSVTKAGAGKLVISSGTTGDDTFTATVEKGTLEIGADATVAAGGKTTVASGATLDVQGALTLHTELANSGTVTATGTNATIAFANATLLSGDGDTAFGSAQAGSVTVTKRGTGQLTLTDGIGAGNTLLFEAGTLSGGMTSGTLSFASLVGQDNLSLTSIAVGGSKLTLSDVGIDLGSLDLTDEAAGTFNLITYTDASKFQLGSNMLVNGNSVDGNGWFYITDGTGAAIGKAQLVATETALQLIVDHSVEINTLVWGTQNGTWVGAGHDGWQDDATYTDGSVVIFSGEGTAANAPLEIALSGDIAPSTIQVSGYYTFQSDTTTAGHLAGIAKLTVGSVNTSEVDGEEVTTPVATVLTLATDNSDWTGDATIMDGAELIATNTNALGTAQVSIEQGGTLTLSSAEGETGVFDLTQTVSGAGALQVKDYAHVKLGNTSITGLTTVSDHAHVEAHVAGALGDVTLKDSAVLTLGDDAAVGGTINFSTGGTLKYADGVTADLSGSITGDTVTVDVGSNTVTWAKTPGTTLVSGSADTTGTLILDNRETQPVDELVVAGGKVKIGHAMALKNTPISNGTANINTISTNITLNGGTLEFTNGYQTDGNGLAASVLARWTYMISGTVTADLASGQSAHITMGTETGYNNGDGIGFANENALTYLATNNGGTLYIDADITGFGSINAVNRKFNIAKSTGAVDGAEVVINGQLGNNGNNNTDSSRIIIDKLGAGTLKIAGANHTPQLKIEEGTVIAAHTQALGRSRNEAQKVIVGTGAATATLDIQADCSTVLLEGNSNGVITNSTDTMHLLVIGEQTANTRASRFKGSITGKLGIRMINGNAGGIRNKLTLTGENTYTGATTLWNNAGIYLDGGSIGTATGSNEVYVYEGAEFQISNGGYVQNTGAKITNVQGQTADMQAVALTASGIDLMKSDGNDRAQGSISNVDVTVSANKYSVANVGLTGSNVTVASGKTLAIGDNVSASGLSLSSAAGATVAAKLTSDSTGHMAIASGDTLKVKDMEISNIAFATETGRSTIDITAGELLKGSVQADASETAPTTTTALLKDCSLKNTDVIISAVGATEAFAAANGTDGHLLGTPYTLDIMSGVKLAAGDSFSLELMGLENYTNVKLYWSSTGLVTGGDLDGATDLAGTVNLDNNSIGSMVYNGGQVLFENGVSGHVVNVWATFNIPEPTTGVLSVMALAGLAARRRRRASDTADK